MSLQFTSLTPVADQLFPEFDFGHEARNKRFRRVVDALLAHPDETLSDRFHDPNGYLGCLRLSGSPFFGPLEMRDSSMDIYPLLGFLGVFWGR